MGLPYRILNIDHRKELLRGLWLLLGRTGKISTVRLLWQFHGEDHGFTAIAFQGSQEGGRALSNHSAGFWGFRV